MSVAPIAAAVTPIAAEWRAALIDYQQKRAFSDGLPLGTAGEDEAIDVYCEAMDRLIATPAPTGVDLLFKIDLAHTRMEGFEFDQAYLTAIKADVSRLCTGEAA